MESENRHYDIFIAYSKHDMGNKCSKAIYSWLSNKYPLLEVFFDDESSRNTIGTTQELLQSDSIILKLSQDTLVRLEKEIDVEFQLDKDKTGLIEELDAINMQIEKEIVEQEKNEEKPDIEQTDTCKKITAINIIVGQDKEGIDIRFRKRDFADIYPKVFKRYRFLRYLKYKLVYCTNDDKFIIDKEKIEGSLTSKTKKNIERYRQKAIRKKYLLLFIIFAAITLAAIVSLVVKHKTIMAQRDTANELQETIGKYKENISSPIVVIGWGTAKAKFLEGYTPDTVDNITFIHVPSEVAWSVLKDKYKDSDDNSAVIISTGEISLDTKEEKKLTKDGYRIVDLQLDSVPLEIAIYPKTDETYKNYTGGATTIDTVMLSKFINEEHYKNKKAVLVTTSEKSGTLSSYKEKMQIVKNLKGEDDSLKGEYVITPNRKGSLNKYLKGRNSGFAIILQNESYGHKDTNEVILLRVVNDRKAAIKLPIHVYYLVKTDTNHGSFKPVFPNKRVETMFHNLGWKGKYIDAKGDTCNMFITEENEGLIIKLSGTTKAR